MATRTIAVFDLDGTLTHHDTLLPFLRRVCGGMRTSRAVLLQSFDIGRALFGSGSRDLAKERLLARLLQGHELVGVKAAGEAFAERVLSRHMRPEVRSRVDEHRQAGHEMVLISASPEVYVGPIGRRLGFDAVLATRLEASADGMLTGRLDGPNCRGAEKVHRLKHWMGEDPAVLYAYGDSAGDQDLLALADHPIWVRKPIWSGSRALAPLEASIGEGP